MRLAPTAAAMLALACSPGCDRALMPVEHLVYAGWEEGLTLGYEDPTLPPAQRLGKRQQVRVKAVGAAGTALAVTRTFSSLTGQMDLQFLQRNGGVALASGAVLLPEGFPDRVERWEAHGVYNWVVGRAEADLPGVRLPETSRVGVWVESVALDSGARVRTLFLPDIGEAETLTWSRGRWNATNRLVTRGFTEVPAKAADSKAGSPP
jgi:hypothetical protein